MFLHFGGLGVAMDFFALFCICVFVFELLAITN